jgi:hypothetical protein
MIQPSGPKEVMADNSNEEETKSQQTRQWARNKGSKGFCKRGASVGSEYNKEIRLLVKNQEGNELKEPVMPDKEEAKSPFIMKKYETELKQYYFKKERYEEHKAKICVIVKGQCTLNMKNKVESLVQGYELIEANNDHVHHQVIERLKRADVQNARRSAAWILDDLPDSEKSPHNETAGQRAIS